MSIVDSAHGVGPRKPRNGLAERKAIFGDISITGEFLFLSRIGKLYNLLVAAEAHSAATVAIVPRGEISVLLEGKKTVRQRVADLCLEKCGASADGHSMDYVERLNVFLEDIGGHSRAVIGGGGVFVAPRVVATLGHVVWGNPDQWRVVAGFHHGADRDLSILGVARICHHDPLGLDPRMDLVLLEVEPERGQVPPKPLQVADSNTVGTQPVEAYSIGYPLGSSQVFSGPDEETKIQRCDELNSVYEDLEDRMRATIDVFQHSSGSPVFVIAKGHASLYGLVQNQGTGKPDFKCTDHGKCGITREDARKRVCERGTVVIPLASSIGAAKQLERGKVPSGWKCCYASSDTPASPEDPVGRHSIAIP